MRRASISRSIMNNSSTWSDLQPKINLSSIMNDDAGLSGGSTSNLALAADSDLYIGLYISYEHKNRPENK